eukprot:TRINITY_DN658_c1_g1_i5.p2 TRINITY_DN658_c1_g1~~TRINITY_DN658_c1_g1_i5.p2  ORF type:complete len:237 (-),score=-14.08 TRINITY_DN658_c1_g1_i5:680-1390(-)
MVFMFYYQRNQTYSQNMRGYFIFIFLINLNNQIFQRVKTESDYFVVQNKIIIFIISPQYQYLKLQATTITNNRENQYIKKQKILNQRTSFFISYMQIVQIVYLQVFYIFLFKIDYQRFKISFTRSFLFYSHMTYFIYFILFKFLIYLQQQQQQQMQIHKKIFVDHSQIINYLYLIIFFQHLYMLVFFYDILQNIYARSYLFLFGFIYFNNQEVYIIIVFQIFKYLIFKQIIKQIRQ